MPDRFPLYDSAEKGDLPGVKQHLTAGNVNQKGPIGFTPLNIAAEKGHPDVAAYLVKHNASINSSDNYGSTPLHKAAWNNNTKVVEFLLGCDGIDVTAVDEDGETALQFAERQGSAECATLIKAFIASPAFAEAAAAKQQAEDAPMLAAFPVATASEIAADVYAASEEYNSKMAELAARAKAVVAKQEAESAASAGTAAAGDAHDDDVARLTAELAAMKAAKDFKGMKAAKAALEAAKVAEVDAVVAAVPAQYVDGDTLESLRAEAAKLDDTADYDDCCGGYCVKGFAIGNPSKYGRLSALQGGDLGGVYLRESERLIEADDYDLAEVYDTAATAAAEFWGLEPGLGDVGGWWHWFPGRAGNQAKWGPLCVEEEGQELI